jgi:cytosine/adenosine deaminase-related metal-dependent hydrolase
MPETLSCHVDWFITETDRRSDVTVRIGDGRILEVIDGLAADATDLGPVALVPGFVNAHTHLEFSRLSQPFPSTGQFTDWIRAVVKYRAAHSVQTSEAIRSGLAECVRSGTTLVGDIATVGWSSEDYSSVELETIVFQELLGLSPQRVVHQKELAEAHLSVKDHGLTPGLSPHAPYSTDLELVRTSVKISRRTGCPIAIHLAESPGELELLSSGTGEFRELLTEFGIWNDELFRISRRPMDYLKVLADAPRVLIVHGNYLDDEELQFVASQPQMTLVYCPRTHAAFGHTEHPWRRLMELGGRVAIGTDSRASNPDLSVFAELQYLAQRPPDYSHFDLLRLGTKSGRIALGHGANVAASQSVDMTLIGSPGSRIQNPETELFSQRNHVCGTMIHGRWASKPISF